MGRVTNLLAIVCSMELSAQTSFMGESGFFQSILYDFYDFLVCMPSLIVEMR